MSACVSRPETDPVLDLTGVDVALLSRCDCSTFVVIAAMPKLNAGPPDVTPDFAGVAVRAVSDSPCTCVLHCDTRSTDVVSCRHSP